MRTRFPFLDLFLGIVCEDFSDCEAWLPDERPGHSVEVSSRDSAGRIRDYQDARWSELERVLHCTNSNIAVRLTLGIASYAVV